MKTIKLLVALALFSALTIPHSLFAWDESDLRLRAQRPELTEPVGQVSFGLDVRLGGDGRMDKTNSVLLNWFIFPGKTVGIRLGGRYNSLTGNGGSYVRTIGGELNLRFQVKGRRLTPFAETGMCLYRYTVGFSQDARSQYKAGMNFAGGLSLSLGRNGALDFTFRQVVNHARQIYAYADTPGGLPPDDQSFEYYFYCGFGGHADELYNPATFEISYRIPIF